MERFPFQWSEAFKWYSSLPHKENKLNKVCTSDIALSGSVPKVSVFKEIVLGSTDKFDIEKRVVQI
jgi:hypothetical protein